MSLGDALHLPEQPDVLAPDGSEVRILLARAGGGMAHFRLEPYQASHPVRHRSVEEIWFILSGHGEMWQSDGNTETIIPLRPNLCLTIPAQTAFQFRSTDEPLNAIGITMPPWPGPEEAEAVGGPWIPTAGGG
jgi:mannose-6-phosphate isomerase-like protein (cupin superfamily)